MKNNYLLLLAVFSAILLLPLQSFAIKKCQDADGKWHYGDVSVDVCSNSDITTLNERGFVSETLDAPKSEEELKAEQEKLAAEEAESMRLKEAQEEKLRILSIYETEADIDRQRDNQLSSVDGNIKVHEAYLKSMDARIARYEIELSEMKHKTRRKKLEAEIVAAKDRVIESAAELEKLKEQRQGIVERFANEKEIYITLKESE